MSSEPLLNSGIQSSRLLVAAAHCLPATVGSSGIRDSQVSRFSFQVSTWSDPMSLRPLGSRLNSFAPLWAREDSLALLTGAGAWDGMGAGVICHPVLGLWVSPHQVPPEWLVTGSPDWPGRICRSLEREGSSVGLRGGADTEAKSGGGEMDTGTKGEATEVSAGLTLGEMRSLADVSMSPPPALPVTGVEEWGEETGSTDTEHAVEAEEEEEDTGVVEGDVGGTKAAASVEERGTEPMEEGEEEGSTGAVLTEESTVEDMRYSCWCRTARSLLRSRSEGPRWRGRLVEEERGVWGEEGRVGGDPG